MAEVVMKRVVRHPEQFDCAAYSRDDAEAIFLATRKWGVSFGAEAHRCEIVSRERVRERFCRKCGKRVFTAISETAKDLCPGCDARERHDRERFFRGSPVKRWRYEI